MGINAYNGSNSTPIDRLGALVGVVKAGKDTYDSFKKSSQESDERALMADPNSPLSQEVRRQAGSAGIQVPENLTAKTAKETGLLDYVQKSALEKQKQAGDKKLEIAKLHLQQQQDKAPKTDQFKSATFAKRAEQAEGELRAVMDGGFDPTTLSANVQGFGITPEILKSSEYKRFDQAKRNFVSAVLRPESGAAISKEEYANEDMKYFPQPGDTPEVIAQKADARAQVVAGLRAAAGKAYDQVPTIEASTFAGHRTKQGGGVVPDAVAGDASNQVRVIEGVTYMKTKGGWKRM